MKELLKKLRKYEIRIRKAINNQMQGDFHSIFKGSGLEFDDVRPYQYGDDTRSIDWNVTAKGHGTYVKTFKEEREQTVFFILDVSGSQEIGKAGQQKIDVGKEICALLSTSALKEASQVGLVCFSDQKEKFIKPGKGMKHAYEIISSLFNLKVRSSKTNINAAVLYVMRMIKKKSVIVMISDFIDEDYFHNLKGLARKHDLVIIQVFDRREKVFPRMGIVPLLDNESKRIVWVNTSSGKFKRTMRSTYESNRERLQEFCLKHQVNYLAIDTEEDYVPKLIKLFRVRNKSRKVG